MVDYYCFYDYTDDEGAYGAIEEISNNQSIVNLTFVNIDWRDHLYITVNDFIEILEFGNNNNNNDYKSGKRQWDTIELDSNYNIPSDMLFWNTICENFKKIQFEQLQIITTATSSSSWWLDTCKCLLQSLHDNPNCVVKSLEFNGCLFLDNAFDISFLMSGLLCDEQHTIQNLRFLSCQMDGDWNIEPKKYKTASKHTQKNELKVLDLSGCALTDDQICQIVEFLNPFTIHELRLHDNQCGNKGLTAISNLLTQKQSSTSPSSSSPCCCTLYSLDLSYQLPSGNYCNSFSDFNLSLLCSGLRNNNYASCLRKLDLSMQILHYKHYEILQYTVQYDNYVLSQIDLDPNEKYNSSIRLIHYYCDLNFAGRRLLCQQQQQCNNMKHFNKKSFIPSGLWSLVLERLGNSQQHFQEFETSQRIASTMFYFIREGHGQILLPKREIL